MVGVCIRVGIVTNASVAEANIHGANGIAQLNARAMPSFDGADGCGPVTVARVSAVARREERGGR